VSLLLFFGIMAIMEIVDRVLIKAGPQNQYDEEERKETKKPSTTEEENKEFIMGNKNSIYWGGGNLRAGVKAANERRRTREKERRERRIINAEKRKERKRERLNNLKSPIIKLLNELGTKMPASDIDAHLKHQNVDEVKEVCKELYHNGEISRTGNYRYFILTEEKKTPKKRAAKKSDPTAEIRKYAKLRDDGLITEEEYQAKKKEILGL